MRVTLAVVLVAAIVVPAAAQTDTGEVSGVVRDTQGGVLPGVTIVAEHLESGTRLERVTFDHRHVFAASATYQLPAFTRIGRVASSVLGSWRPCSSRSQARRSR